VKVTSGGEVEDAWYSGIHTYLVCNLLVGIVVVVNTIHCEES